MKQHSPLRILSGHMTDVECIEFHPNSHYIATGASDKQIRLWEIETGECVRLMFTVPGSVRSLKFTKNGLFLLAGNDAGLMVVFDLIKGSAIDVI
jgi:transcription initiation factor TFIID subunit 5